MFGFDIDDKRLRVEVQSGSHSIVNADVDPEFSWALENPFEDRSQSSGGRHYEIPDASGCGRRLHRRNR
jgi:hypothetical protein